MNSPIYQGGGGGLLQGGTVNGNLIITGDLTVQGSFNFGDAGTDILTVYGYIQGHASGKTFVAVGNVTTAHSLNATNDFAVGGELEVQGASFLDGQLNLPSGHVVSWNSGDVTLTHEANGLRFAGNGGSSDLQITDNGRILMSASDIGDSVFYINHTVGSSQGGAGTINVIRSGAVAGIATQTDASYKLVGSISVTDSASGTYTWSGAHYDLSGISVTAGVGDTDINGLWIVMPTDTDIANNRGIKIDMGSGAAPITTTDPTAIVTNAYFDDTGGATQFAGVDAIAYSNGFANAGTRAVAHNAVVSNNVADAAGTVMGAYSAAVVDNGGSGITAGLIIGPGFDYGIISDGAHLKLVAAASGSTYYGVLVQGQTIDTSAAGQYGLRISQELNDTAGGGDYAGLSIKLTATDTGAWEDTFLIDASVGNNGFDINFSGTVTNYITSNVADEAPTYLAHKDSTAPAAGHEVGVFAMSGQNDNTPQDTVVYAGMVGIIGLPTTGSETGKLSLAVQDSTSADLFSPTFYLTLDGTAANESVNLLKKVVASSSLAVGTYGIFGSTTANANFTIMAERDFTPGIGNDGAQILVSGGGQITEAASGVHNTIAGITIQPLTIVNGTATTTNLAALYIEDAPTGITPTNGPYSIFVDAGATRLDGILYQNDAIYFTQTDGNEKIDSAADGYLDYTVTTAHRFNMSAADTDVRLEFIGTTNSGLLEWMEDEDYFRFGDSILMNGGSFTVDTTKTNNVETKLGSATGIDMKTIAATNLFTVPAGKVAIITHVAIRITASTNPTVVAQVSVGKSASYTEWKGTTALTTVDTPNEMMMLTAENTNTQYFVAGDVLGIKVQVGATADSETGAAELFGYLLDA